MIWSYQLLINAGDNLCGSVFVTCCFFFCLRPQCACVWDGMSNIITSALIPLIWSTVAPGFHIPAANAIDHQRQLKMFLVCHTSCLKLIHFACCTHVSQGERGRARDRAWNHLWSIRGNFCLVKFSMLFSKWFHVKCSVDLSGFGW